MIVITHLLNQQFGPLSIHIMLDYQLTDLDKRFITELTLSKRACITRN